MADIKLTLSSRATRAPSIEAEAEWMAQAGPLYYPLGANRPKNADRGGWVYFIRAGELAGRAQIEDFVFFKHPLDSQSFSGGARKLRGWQVKCSRIEVAGRGIAAEGFQAFRYVRGTEVEAFAAAFRTPRPSR